MGEVRIKCLWRALGKCTLHLVSSLEMISPVYRSSISSHGGYAARDVERAVAKGRNQRGSNSGAGGRLTKRSENCYKEPEAWAEQSGRRVVQVPPHACYAT